MPVLNTQPGSPTRFTVDCEIVLLATKAPGNAYAYRKGRTSVDLTAASSHPADILAVLNANVPLSTGEQIEILQIKARDWNSVTALN
jgi:hypothetical protein